MRDDCSRLQDILDSIKLIEKTLKGTLKVYDISEIEFQGILRCLEIIGEAAKTLSDKVKNEYAQIPWRAISDMRNVLVHQYFDVDHEKVEMVLQGPLEDLKIVVEKLLNEI